eukprot:CCRYP_013223-RA/>CCRYP_013223-RA protein AED:0.41 eAED:0.41 QI:0/0/0/1/0/0/4/0/726
MEMRFFWVTDQVNQNFFNVRWQPGQENLADYFTKHFEPRHHLNVRPWYLHTSASPTLLPRANALSSLQGCVGTLPNGYTCASPLPRIPRATAHFIIKGAMVKNKQPTCNPLKIKLPDGSVNQSTHTCNLDIPWLPDTVTEAHIVPGLAHSLLVATRKFCDAGCKISFDLDGCRIIYKGNVVLTGTRDPSSGLWRVPINPTSTLTTLNHLDLSNIKKDQQYAANLYTLPFKQQQLKYMHQSFFSPPPHTLIKAINKGQLEGIPFMKADLVRKYLAPSPATSKGRMKRPRQGIRSTRQRPHMATEQEYPMKDTPSSFTTNANIIPIEPTDGCACNVLCYAALADKHSGTMYTDATGALPAVSLEGNQYYFIAYAYDLNCIFALPISNLRDETILTAFDEVFQTLKSKGFKPAFNVTDNQAATPIKNISVKSKQFVEPNNHRVNAAERAIQTYKNHFISGLCTTDSEWPLQLWDNLTEQALITLNLPRTSRLDPTKSAYHQLHGHKYDWNTHPLAPPGTKAIVYESPHGRASWGSRGLDACYCGPSFDHYRNCNFYVPSTKSYRTSGSFDLFPQHCILPSFTPEQHTQEVYNELFESIQKLKKPAKRKFINRVAKALDILATTPQPTSPTSEGEPNSEGDTNDIVFQRVNESPKVTTSNNPTDPALIKNIEHFCNGVQHPVTGETITKYKKLINIPQMRVVWTTAFGKNSVTLPKAVTRLGRRVLTLSL